MKKETSPGPSLNKPINLTFSKPESSDISYPHIASGSQEALIELSSSEDETQVPVQKRLTHANSAGSIMPKLEVRPHPMVGDNQEFNLHGSRNFGTNEAYQNAAKPFSPVPGSVSIATKVPIVGELDGAKLLQVPTEVKKEIRTDIAAAETALIRYSAPVSYPIQVGGKRMRTEVQPPCFEACPLALTCPTPVNQVLQLPGTASGIHSSPRTKVVTSSGQLDHLNEDAVKRQFWHAGDYEAKQKKAPESEGGMDHVRVHPKFLHSNATSHKWALGALAELLDNSVDEISHGATYCTVDVVPSPKDSQPMLIIEDNGGGMNPDRLRACMSLGYSEKSKRANTIGQYGNGFKTSTMRLGADVIVFSRCCSSPDVASATQSIGLLSFTFLRETGLQDIVVPMVDYDVGSGTPSRHTRGSESRWQKNLEVVTKWSPYDSEQKLLEQFGSMGVQGTRVVVYNLWLADDGNLELDFLSDEKDIQLRGARDEKLIGMANSGKYPNSNHFLTYRHSLRSYAAILYLRLPPEFRIFLRGTEVTAHSIADDLMHREEVLYRPKGDDVNGMMASVTLGFVKDAKEHIDVQGFCVYHKNRLIKPFWRIWNSAGIQGRGVVGVLEANFVEPAHDKQGFERTDVLRKLEERLLKAQKVYWNKNSNLIGYVGWNSRKPVSLNPNAPPTSAPPPSAPPVMSLALAPLPAPLSSPAAPSEPQDVKPVIHRQETGSRRPLNPNHDPTYRPPSGTQRCHPPEQSAEGGAEEAEAVRAPVAAEGIEPMGSQNEFGSSQGGVQQLVDSIWLAHLVEENRDLKSRCEELERALGKVQSRRVEEEEPQKLRLRVRELEEQVESEQGEREILVQQHRVAEEHLRERIKELQCRLRAADSGHLG